MQKFWVEINTGFEFIVQKDSDNEVQTRPFPETSPVHWNTTIYCCEHDKLSKPDKVVWHKELQTQAFSRQTLPNSENLIFNKQVAKAKLNSTGIENL